MSYLCLTRDVPEYPKTININGIFLTKRGDSVLNVPEFCKHMGYPLIENKTFSPICKIHNVFNKIPHPTFLKVVADTYIFFTDDELPDLPTLDGYSEYGFASTPGTYSQRQWLENTMDTSHIEHVHKDSFAPILDTSDYSEELLSHGASSMRLGVHPDKVRGLHRLIDCSSYLFTQYTIPPDLSVTVFCNAMMSVEKIIDGNAFTRFFVREEVTSKEFLNYVLQGNIKILREDAAMLNKLDTVTYNHGLLKNSDTRIAWLRKHRFNHTWDGKPDT